MSQKLHSSWHTIYYSLSSVNDLESTLDYNVLGKYQKWTTNWPCSHSIFNKMPRIMEQMTFRHLQIGLKIH